MTKPIRKRTRAAEGKKWFHTGSMGLDPRILQLPTDHVNMDFIDNGPFETFEGAKADLRMQLKAQFQLVWDAFVDAGHLKPD